MDELLDEDICEVLKSNQDPSGSYTGVDLLEGEVPEQDADDL